MGANGAALLEVEGLRKSVGSQEILRGVSFDVPRGRLAVLLGPSGSGKSTLLRCVNGLETFDRGRVRVGEVVVETTPGNGAAAREAAVREVRRRTGMVFQQWNLFPHLTALGNVALAPRVVKGVPRAEADERAAALLRKVGLADKAGSFPSQLSGGQQQRVAIARALAMEPEVMLYDEPTSALDPALVAEVLGVMRALKDEGLTQVVVTHEMRFAREAADEVLFLAAGELAERAPAADFFANPRDPRAREFLGRAS
ncbi:MAG: amino acid ABC transporter ATP-binding protein [Planctomycetales bacterium]|nr:amino acid ABC transporter ATP-binding protein [Planctomycetales bacterium]